VIHFAQTRPELAAQVSRAVGSSPERIMVIRKNDKHKEYAGYAEHCLQIVPKVPDQEYQAIQREMAAEWIRLAETVLRPLDPTK
jgi:hypothetical protein